MIELMALANTAVEMKLIKQLSELHDLLKNIGKTEKNPNVFRNVRHLLSIIESKPYLRSNIDDLLWFYSHGLSECRKILDFGCGSGYISYMLSFLVNKVIGYEYKGSTIGVNLSTDGMSVLQQIILNNSFRKKQENLEFHFYEKLPLNIENETFDGIVLYAVIEHLDEKIKENVLSELHRILKPEGYLFLAKLPSQYSYQEQLARLLNIPSHKILFTRKSVMDLLDNRFSVRNIERADLFFQYPPLTNVLFPNMRTETLIKNYLNFLTFIAHNFRIVAIKRE